MLTDRKFNDRFKIVNNKADGNCLFESIEHTLMFSEYEFTHGITNSKKIRKMIGEFYANFNKDIDYEESTIEFRIKMGMLFDNVDISENNNEIPHELNIWNDGVWASMTDVLICSFIFKMNIHLFVKNSNVTFEGNDIVCETMYEVSKIESQYNFTKTICLLYSGGNHFEALEKKR